MKNVIRFLFNIPGKSFWAIMTVIMLTLAFIFIALPIAIVQWVQSTDEHSSLKEDLKEAWEDYTHEMGLILSEAISNE